MYHTEHVFANIYTRKAPVITYKRRQNTFNGTDKPLASTIITTDSTLFGAVPIVRDAPLIEQQQTTSSKPTLIDDRNRKTELQQTIGTRTCTSSTDTNDLQTTRLPTMDIFDFPDVDNNDTEVELRIASSLHKNGNKSNKHTTKNTYTKTIKATQSKTSTSTSGKTVKIGSRFITQDDTNLNKVNTTNINRNNIESPTVRLASRDSTTESSSIWDIPDGGMTSKPISKTTSTKRPSSFYRTLSAPTLNIISPTILHTQMMPQISPSHDVKKRKRNLVSQLKGANGERLDFCSQPTGLRFYNMSSDSDDNDNDDDDDSTPHPAYLSEDHPSTSSSTLVVSSSANRQVAPAESSTGPNDYNERMEQELADLMRTEFGQLDTMDNISSTSMLPLPSSSTSSSSSSSSSSTHRPCYVPENAIRAPVTYKRFHNKSTSSTAQSTHELDLEMEQQIQYLLSNDL